MSHLDCITKFSADLFPTIKKGSKGFAVEQWQKIVNVKVDGTFGPDTETATKAFQSQHGLVVDGIVGPKTWDAVNQPKINAAGFLDWLPLWAKVAVATIFGGLIITKGISHARSSSRYY